MQIGDIVESQDTDYMRITQTKPGTQGTVYGTTESDGMNYCFVDFPERCKICCDETDIKLKEATPC